MSEDQKAVMKRQLLQDYLRLHEVPATATLLAHIADRLKVHQDRLEDTRLKPRERNESLHAVKELRALLTHIPDQIAKLRSDPDTLTDFD